MPSPRADPIVKDALVHLLRASRQFADAYDAAKHSPGAWSVRRREALEAAARELDAAEREAIEAQQKLQSK